MRLVDSQGQRLYLTPEERERYFLATMDLKPEKRLFCQLLYYTGCRLSEALAVRSSDVDLETMTVRLGLDEPEDVQRTILLPDRYLAALKRTFHLRRRAPYQRKGKRLWEDSQTTGWRTVKRALALAKIEGPHASPKGVRHGFGVACVLQGIPLPQIQRWMGHRQLSTTEVYLQVLDLDERVLAKRVWAAVD